MRYPDGWPSTTHAALYYNRRRRIRRQRSEPPAELEGERLIFVELTQSDGDKISISKSERAVVAVEQQGGRTIVRTTNGNFTVTEAYADVKAAFEE